MNRTLDRRLDRVEDHLLSVPDREVRDRGRSWLETLRRRADLRRRFVQRIGWAHAEALAFHQFYSAAAQTRTETAWRARQAVNDAMDVSWCEQRAMVDAELLALDGDPVPDDVAATVADVEARQAAAEAELEPELLEALEAQREREARSDLDGDRVITPGTEDPTFRCAFAKFLGAVVEARVEEAHDELGEVLFPNEGPKDLPRRWRLIGYQAMKAP